MGNIRAIVRGTAKDFDAFVDLAERICALVDENEPGTLRYECFVDKEAATFLWHEVYEDPEAFFKHNQNLAEAGVMEEVSELVDFDGMTVLGDVTDPELREGLNGFGAEILTRQVGVVR